MDWLGNKNCNIGFEWSLVFLVIFFKPDTCNLKQLFKESKKCISTINQINYSDTVYIF